MGTARGRLRPSPPLTPRPRLTHGLHTVATPVTHMSMVPAPPTTPPPWSPRRLSPRLLMARRRLSSPTFCHMAAFTTMAMATPATPLRRLLPATLLPRGTLRLSPLLMLRPRLIPGWRTDTTDTDSGHTDTAPTTADTPTATDMVATDIPTTDKHVAYS